jgi:hypothetical protein
LQSSKEKKLSTRGKKASSGLFDERWKERGVVENYCGADEGKAKQRRREKERRRGEQREKERRGEREGEGRRESEGKGGKRKK